MIRINLILIVFFLISNLSLAKVKGPVTPESYEKEHIYIVSIGVSYTDTIPQSKDLTYWSMGCNTCLTDAQGVTNYLKKSKDSVVKSYTYINKDMNIDTLYSVFTEIQKQCKPNDIFVFYYAGISWGSIYNPETNSREGFYALNKICKQKEIVNNSFTLRILKALTDRISANRQLIIFDTGNGDVIQNDYYSNFFCDNPIEAHFTKKNRVIICPEVYSSESFDKKDSIQKGDLYRVISDLPNELNVFNLFDTAIGKSWDDTYKEFMKAWYEQQLKCSSQVKILKESDYLKILTAIKPIANSGKRGIVSASDEREVDSSKLTLKKKALIIATNEYDGSAVWRNLRNPVNDGKAAAEILHNSYNYEVTTLFNAPHDSIMQAIDDLCNGTIKNPYSQYIIYFAGHGYYDGRQKTGYIVCKDSKAFKDVAKPTMIELNSYLDYHTLFNNIDASLNKVVFIADVCFGGTSLNSVLPVKADVNPSNEKEKEKNPYKTVLASGVTEVGDFLKLQTGGISQNSPFATALLEVLKKKKENLTFDDLFSGIAEKHLSPEPIDFMFGTVSKPNEFIF